MNAASIVSGLIKGKKDPDTHDESDPDRTNLSGFPLIKVEATDQIYEDKPALGGIQAMVQ